VGNVFWCTPPDLASFAGMGALPHCLYPLAPASLNPPCTQSPHVVFLLPFPPVFPQPALLPTPMPPNAYQAPQRRLQPHAKACTLSHNPTPLLSPGS
jgi:hypothetical protein